MITYVVPEISTHSLSRHGCAPTAMLLVPLINIHISISSGGFPVVCLLAQYRYFQHLLFVGQCAHHPYPARLEKENMSLNLFYCPIQLPAGVGGLKGGKGL